MQEMTLVSKKDKRKQLEEWASEHGYGLARDADILLTLMYKQVEKKGDLYCPCRIYRKEMSNKEKNDIKCPCVHAEREIKENGQCLCGMFFLERKV